MLQCYNRGCGQTFDPENNKDDSCCHHPGEPYFHDAYKGWSCCKKKSVDFTEFLNTKGCAFAKHSNVKPPEPEKPLKDNAEKDKVVEVRAPIREPLPRPSLETPLVKIIPTVALPLKQSIDKMKSLEASAVNKANCDGAIAVGTACKNFGCTYAYSNNANDDVECRYHPGSPVFHEGMKYWSCCQKKTTDFTAFMSQEGCAHGSHKWIKENKDDTSVSCRYDWHQTGRNVIVSIYAKLYHYEKSIILVSPVRLKVCLVFPEQSDGEFNLDLELKGIINVSQTTVQMYGSKVEITMPKAEPVTWAKLNFPEAKLPPPQVKTTENSRSESEDDFNLDDIETLKPEIRLADLS